MAYKSELERFDMERGNVLSVEREMVKGITKLGEEIAGPILFRLYTWFAGNPGDATPEMADPRDNVFLAMLIEHQRKNAARRADFLAKQQEKGLASGAARRATKDNHGQPRSTEVNQVQGKEEVEEESPKGKDFPSSTTSDKSEHADGTPAPAAGGHCVTAAPDGTRTATRVAYVEPLTGEQIIERTFDEAELRARPVSFMLEAIGETGDQRTRNALTKAVEELGRDTYAETCWRFVADMVQAENDCSAVIVRAREVMTKRHGGDTEGEAALVNLLRDIERNGSTKPANDWFVVPWQKWRDFTPGRFLMARLNEARLAAGIPTRRKPGKRKGGEA